jgi:hypothetical protein
VFAVSNYGLFTTTKINVNIKGWTISREEARRLILSNYQVPEEIRRERQRRKATANSIKARRKGREMAAHRTNEAAIAPQPVLATPSPKTKFN